MAARTVEQICEHIGRVSGTLDALAGPAECNGAATTELVEVMRELRVPLVKTPFEAGGDMLGLVDQFRFFDELAYWNPTAAWTGFNHAGASGMSAARLCDEGLATVFPAGAVPFMAAVAAPTGTHVRTDDGIVLTGTWHYASGVTHAEWVLLVSLPADGKGAPLAAAVRTADLQVSGTWDVMALKGTGSLTVSCTSLAVPAALTYSPVGEPLRGGPMFAMPYQGYVAPENLGFTMGVARRFLDETARYAHAKSRGPAGALVDRGAFQYELGRAVMQVEAARGFCRDAFRAADELVVSDRFGAADNEHLAGVIASATEMTVQATVRLFHFGGAGALFNENILQRCFRDIVGSGQHLVASNSVFDAIGRRTLARHT
ncbi:MAG: hypothetical protein RLZZ544_650 [Actinomycetota bacterium]|jgi:alkylation response protein AidB-like acyl-CoA dehydrogenase